MTEKIYFPWDIDFIATESQRTRRAFVLEHASRLHAQKEAMQAEWTKEEIIADTFDLWDALEAALLQREKAEAGK